MSDMTKDLQESGVALFNKLVKKKQELDPRPDAPPAENERRPDAIVVQKVARCLSAGLTRQLAASYAGVAPTRIEQWMRKGEDGHPDYVEAWQLIVKAEAEAALSMLDVVAGAATGGAGYDATAQDWKAAAWILERRFPNAYGKTVVETEHAVRAETEEDRMLLDRLLGKK